MCRALALAPLDGMDLSARSPVQMDGMAKGASKCASASRDPIAIPRLENVLAPLDGPAMLAINRVLRADMAKTAYSCARARMVPRATMCREDAHVHLDTKVFIVKANVHRVSSE